MGDKLVLIMKKLKLFIPLMIMIIGGLLDVKAGLFNSGSTKSFIEILTQDTNFLMVFGLLLQAIGLGILIKWIIKGSSR